MVKRSIEIDGWVNQMKDLVKIVVSLGFIIAVAFAVFGADGAYAKSVEDRTSIHQIGDECSEVCEIMKIKLSRASQEVSSFLLVNGVDVAVRYQYRDASLVVLADDREEAEKALHLMRDAREIMLANSVVMSRYVILTRDGSDRGVSSTLIARVDKSLLRAYAAYSFIGYGDELANKMHYCYFHWEGNSIFRKSYSSYNECVGS